MDALLTAHPESVEGAGCSNYRISFFIVFALAAYRLISDASAGAA